MQNVILNNGVETPILGFGVYQVPDHEECETSVLEALQVGDRLIDTAAAYMTEHKTTNVVVVIGAGLIDHAMNA